MKKATETHYKTIKRILRESGIDCETDSWIGKNNLLIGLYKVPDQMCELRFDDAGKLIGALLIGVVPKSKAK